MNKPNLFIVGLPKAGTTSLHNYLAQHPEIHMSSIKEPYFFCIDLYEESLNYHKKKIYKFRFTNNEINYLKLFEGASTESIIGESTPVYIFSKVAPYQINKFNPESKILICLREPVSFLYSLHSQNVIDNYETEKDFYKALTMEKDRKDGRYIPEHVPYPSFLYYTEKIKYQKYISNFTRYFDINRIKILLFEDLVTNPQSFLIDVLEFLEIDANFYFDINKYNINAIDRFELFKNIRSKVINNKLFTSIDLHLPNSLHNILVNFYKFLFYKDKSRDILSTKLRTDLMKQFKPEVEYSSQVAKIDLISKWGYEYI